MPANVIHRVVDALKPQVIERLAAALGEPPAATRKALTAALPAAVLGLAAKARDTKGADLIRDTMHASRIDGSLLDGLVAKTPAPGQGGGLLAGGVAAAERLLASPTHPVAERLALYADVRRSSALTLLGLSVPLILAAVERSYPKPLDTQTLQRALQEQVPAARHATPPGFGAPIMPAPAPTPPAAAAPPRPLEAWQVLAGIVLLVFFGLGFWAAMRGAGGQLSSQEQAAIVAPVVTADGSRGENRVVLPDGTPVDLTPGSFAHALHGYLRSDAPAGRHFVLEGLSFEKNDDELQPESRPVLDVTAAVLAAHPDATVRIEGFTDSWGLPRRNQRLSRARAAAVAEALMERGVSPVRIDSAGRGPEQPVASNDSDEGRAANRRVELVVVSKRTG